MAFGRLTLIAERDEKNPQGWMVGSPSVGRLLSIPPRGTILGKGAPAGLLRVLRRDFELIVPEDCRGVVEVHLVDGKRPMVEYGQPLFRLGPGILTEGEDVIESVATTHEEVEIPAGMLAVKSPTDGVFYRRSSPDASPYVDEGTEVERGSILALVEVMKCFNQIVYGKDEGVPEKGKIHRILPEDAQEVKFDQLLFIIDPA